ncbi:DUF1997 domain-containing protein [Synechococcus sp. CCY9201]|jgi:hypothetical protein|uniref:DUF1997 domain-containing protein n=1 Tax=unclassified Synechococcus TaxID=2626047 RepID=UPI0018CFD7D9|nr:MULTISPECIES: DUF1997 domain-containing protein [unclassified Synechococcus]MEA5422516.1 DUF1997 domain-containing protein [Synechococcus sp. CCY9202]MEA5474401.1 DUF1997 domain-containing protein [Synechococcus sp. CCY9201]QPN61188.1 DUF1997 domain-containing protein [Synechococcus sp. CBW1002]QPN67077.1 DUF1997 domain-containing protein [Synechococcus sp. CBW1006]CAK6701455.1 hypothetical protein IFHNHDMJ_03111 [Synechococcus sp. CBW1107]
MSVAFSASQSLKLSLPAEDCDRVGLLPPYLDDEERVIGALLDPSQLERLEAGRYRYAVTRLQVFQLQIQPVVVLQVRRQPGRIELNAIDCELEGLGLIDDFQLTLQSWLEAADTGLEGEATLAVTVSQPPLLKLIPTKVLEATGHSVLSRILLGIRTRVGQQLLGDFRDWCTQA